MLILAERDEQETWHIKYLGEMPKTLTLKTWWEQTNRRKWQDNIKLDVKEVFKRNAEIKHLTQNKIHWRALVNTKTIFKCHKRQEILTFAKR